ncbi:hypothetical protein GS429_21275 [Natronorubrum sp. JWXQ-INN-674]|uniref:Zinc ribbon domain-containing protein n=1 Tax=Natronorubrum halalkaliphilum TaxID=2691917 RepID=A0A6B0VSP8_9EURY|nr:hypothetical protein [Natronorubrum halalkaliphilum]MXV64558.1 hypothetical protein [Natronorubrum halalkaliphilum]
MAKTGPCSRCSTEIACEAVRCPSCGYEPAARRKRAGWLALVVSVPLFVLLTGVLGYQVLFALMQGTLGRMGPVLFAFTTVWLVTALVISLVRKQRTATATNDSVL